MPLTADIVKFRYGSAIDHQPIEYKIGKGASGQTLYRGSVAAISGGTTVTQGYLKNMATPASGDIVVGLIDRSMLQSVTAAAQRAADAGRRLLMDVAEPWPNFVADIVYGYLDPRVRQ